MAIDPRIILELQGVNTGQALRQGQQGLQNVLALQQAGQNRALGDQALQRGEQQLQQQQAGQQQLAEAREFKTNIQPFIGTDPFKALENVQNSTVLDDDDKRQIIGAINAEASGNPAPLQALNQLTDQALGTSGGAAEQFTLSPGQTRFQGSQPIAFGGAKPEDPQAAEKRVARDVAADKAKFSQAATIRKEISSTAGDFDKIVGSFDRISASDDSGPGDLSMIFNFMKMLDPGSTVREGEFASAENAGGIPEKIRNTFNKLNTGERLTPRQRASFLSQSEKLFAKSKARHDKTIANFVKLASKFGLERDLVIVPRGEDIGEAGASMDLTTVSDEDLFNF